MKQPQYTEPDPEALACGQLVRVRRTKTAPIDRRVMSVVSHAGGTVRCRWIDGGECKEENFSSCDLEKVKEEGT